MPDVQLLRPFASVNMGPSDMSIPRASAPNHHATRQSPSQPGQRETTTAPNIVQTSTAIANLPLTDPSPFASPKPDMPSLSHTAVAHHRRRTSTVQQDITQSWPVRFEHEVDTTRDVHAPLAVRLGLVEPAQVLPYLSPELFAGVHAGAEPCKITKTQRQESQYVHRKLHGYYLLTPPPRGKDRAEISLSSRPSSPEPASRSSPLNPGASTHKSSGVVNAASRPAPTPITSPSLAISLASPRSSGIDLQSESSSVKSGLIAPTTGKIRPGTADSGSSMGSSDSGLHKTARSHARDGKSSRGSSSSEFEPHQELWSLDDYFMKRRSRTGGRICAERYHAYQPTKLPWRFSYNADSTITQELWHHIAHEVVGKHLLSEFPGDIMPKRVLDVGCGPGIWIADVAKQPGWEHSEFVGLDAVPCQTLLLDPDLARRVSWVVSNALDGLKEFPEASFDFVHCRFLGNNSIPEDSWPDLIAAMTRVLAPGGRLEILEADVAFYGTPHRIPAHELKELAAGVGNVALRVNIKNGRHGEEFDPLERVCLRALEQRGISFSPLAQLPAILMLEHDLMDVRCGNPRVLPLMAEPGFVLGGPKPRQPSPSSTPTADLRAQDRPDSPRAADDPPSAPTSPSLGLPEPNRNPAYTNRAPVGTPLRGSTFRMPDLELIRCMMLISEVHLYTGSRNILWQEAEADKKAASRPASRYGANGDSGEPYAHPWSDEAAFHRTIDRWVADITNRAAVRGLLKKTLGWDSNAAQARAKETDQTSSADASNGPSPPTASSAADPWSSSYSRSSAKEVAPSTSQRPQSLNSAQNAENAAQLHKMHRERRNSHKTTSSRPTSPRFSDYGDRTAESKSSAHRQRESLPPTPRIPKIPLLGVKRTTGFTAIRKPTKAAS